MSSAGRIDPFRRMRGRQGHYRAGDAEDLAVLRSDVLRPDVCDLFAGNIALAAPARHAVATGCLAKVKEKRQHCRPEARPRASSAKKGHLREDRRSQP